MLAAVMLAARCQETSFRAGEFSCITRPNAKCLFFLFNGC